MRIRGKLCSVADEYMNNYFISFRQLTYLGVNNIHATIKGYRNALSLGKNSCKIRNVATLKSVHQAKKQCDFDSGWLERQQCNFAIYLDSSESCEPRRFVWCWMEQKWIYVYVYTFKNNNQISSTVTTRAEFCQQNGPEHGQVLVSEWKNGGGSRMFEW